MARTTDHLKMTPFYGFFHNIIQGIFQAFFRGEVVGTDFVPVSGPYLIACNHASHLDPPLIGCQIARQIRFFARKTLWDSKFVGWWLTQIESIAVDRDSGDVGAIRKVLAALSEDRAIVLFPEGTRSPDGHLQKPKAGVGLMACKSGVLVVPCRIYGSYEAYGKGRLLPRLGTPITIVFGAPIPAADYDDPSRGKARYETAAQRIMDRIAALPRPVYPVI